MSKNTQQELENKEIENILDKAEEEINDVDKINDICNQVLRNYNHINSISLYRIGFLFFHTAKFDRAEQVWQDAINVTVEENDKFNKAFILHNIATMKANTGNFDDAYYLLKESLEIKQEINDIAGSAATLNNLAWIAKNKNNKSEEMELLLKSSYILADIGFWNELADNLIKLYDAESDNEKKLNYLLQAFYISTKIIIPTKNFLYILVNLVNNLGIESKYSRYFVATSIIINNFEDKEITDISQKLLIAIALNENIKEEFINQWVIDNKLNDTDSVLEKLQYAYQELNKDSEWVFIPEKLNANLNN